MSEIDTTSVDVETDERIVECSHWDCSVKIDLDNDTFALDNSEDAHCERCE